jgi:hypothetical protein
LKGAWVLCAAFSPGDDGVSVRESRVVPDIHKMFGFKGS